MGDKYTKFESKSDHVKITALFDNFRAEFLDLKESEMEELLKPF